MHGVKGVMLETLETLQTLSTSKEFGRNRTKHSGHGWSTYITCDGNYIQGHPGLQTRNMHEMYAEMAGYIACAGRRLTWRQIARKGSPNHWSTTIIQSGLLVFVQAWVPLLAKSQQPRSDARLETLFMFHQTASITLSYVKSTHQTSKVHNNEASRAFAGPKDRTASRVWMCLTDLHGFVCLYRTNHDTCHAL